MEEVPSVAPAEMLDFLTKPESYPHRPPEIELIQTHASYVALAGPTVYKVKKPVNLGFLDFTTLERRRHFCEEEVRLNRRLCSRIYEGVVPIRRGGEGLCFGETGEVVDYAVKMRRLEDGGFLPDVITEDEDQELLDPVIDVLSAFYRRLRPRDEVQRWGQLDKLRISTDENFDQTAQFVGEIIPPPMYDAIQAFTDRFYATRQDLLERRWREGHILDCHGDLRAEHIHFSANGVCIYDCIEFNERLRYIDVANDVAFLAMDLDFLGKPRLGRYVIDQISRQIIDPELPLLTDFYSCYRAYVRGKVDCMRASEAEVGEAERREGLARAREFFQLALRYAVLGSEPTVLVVMGGVGAGKSTQARRLSELLGIDWFSSDRLRKEMAGVPIYERGDALARARLYSPERTSETYAALQDRAIAEVAAGRSAILDATYARAAHRAQLRSAMEQASIRLRFVELRATEDTVRARLVRRGGSGEEVSDARIEDLEILRAQYEPLGAEESDCVSIRTDGSRDSTTSHVLNRLIQLNT